MKNQAVRASGHIEIEAERCKACELCVAVCPRNCIEIGEERNRQGYAAARFARPEDCTGCALCAESCPDVCIRVWR